MTFNNLEIMHRGKKFSVAQHTNENGDVIIQEVWDFSDNAPVSFKVCDIHSLIEAMDRLIDEGEV
jgi:hypothetical protein